MYSNTPVISRPHSRTAKINCPESTAYWTQKQSECISALFGDMRWSRFLIIQILQSRIQACLGDFTSIFSYFQLCGAPCNTEHWQTAYLNVFPGNYTVLFPLVQTSNWKWKRSLPENLNRFIQIHKLCRFFLLLKSYFFLHLWKCEGESLKLRQVPLSYQYT